MNERIDEYIKISDQLNALTINEFLEILMPHHNDEHYIREKWQLFQQNRIGFCLSRNPKESGRAIIQYAITKMLSTSTEHKYDFYDTKEQKRYRIKLRKLVQNTVTRFGLFRKAKNRLPCVLCTYEQVMDSESVKFTDDDNRYKLILANNDITLDIEVKEIHDWDEIPIVKGSD